MCPTKLPESIYDVIEKSDLLEAFRSFLEKRLALENLEFYENVKVYEGIEDNALREKKGKEIVTEFVSMESETALNLPFSLREPLLEVTEFLPNTFSPALKEVLTLLQMNFLRAFCSHLKGENNQEFPELTTQESTELHCDHSSEGNGPERPFCCEKKRIKEKKLKFRVRGLFNRHKPLRSKLLRGKIRANSMKSSSSAKSPSISHSHHVLKKEI